MKIMFLSDIHGIKTNLDKIKKRFQEEHCDKLVVLGDLYYIGPKNTLQDNYDISYVKSFLESFKDQLICIRGNCDSDIDVEISDFPIINELGMISVDGNDLYITHGHIYNENNWQKENSILIFGHYHKPFIQEIDHKLFINPGSISLPKGEESASYLLFDGKEFIIYDIWDNVLARKTLN